MQSTAILFTAANEIALGSFELPEPGPGELLLQTRYTCVSPGTELRVLSGKQADLPAWPLIPGYALVGEVVARGAGTQIAEGTLVFCTGTGQSNLARTWGGHVAHAVISEERAFLIPTGVDLIEAAMAKLAAIAYHGARLSHPRPDETVAVVGLGPIGQLAARIHAAMGARVVAADVSARRVAEAQAAGLEAYVVRGTLHDTLGAAIPGGADVVVDATGAPHVIAQAVELAREMGWGDGAATSARYLVQGSYADSFSIPYQSAFARELNFLLPRDQLPRDLRAVLDLFARGKLHVRDLISDIRTPARAAETYAELRDSQAALTTVVFDWQ